MVRQGRARAKKWTEEARQLWSILCGDPFFMLGVGLYLGEGTKAVRTLDLSNSDVNGAADLSRTLS
jgi:hypothetical protein